jgi:hypothetical protein
MHAYKGLDAAALGSVNRRERGCFSVWYRWSREAGPALTATTLTAGKRHERNNHSCSVRVVVRPSSQALAAFIVVRGGGTPAVRGFDWTVGAAREDRQQFASREKGAGRDAGGTLLRAR